jgi:homoserine O-acetyltransferase
MKLSAIFYGIATAGGTLRYQDIAPTRENADQFVDARLAAPFRADANDWIWQWSSSADYDAMPEIDKIRATVLAINAADDERNPPETGVMQEALNRVPNGKLYLIPASTQTSGHLTTENAKFYKDQLQEILQTTPRKTM